MPSLDHVRIALATHQPATLVPRHGRRAAVAMLLRGDPADPEVLFIERAQRPGDPWSGHMAFPGGRAESDAESLRAAAERETLEEVGLRLATAEPLGRLDDLEGHRAAGISGLVIASFVYHLEPPEPLRLNAEVNHAFWFPLRALLDPIRHVGYPASAGGAAAPFPGIQIGRDEHHVVWGLTYRFLESFFRVVGAPMPTRAGP